MNVRRGSQSKKSIYKNNPRCSFDCLGFFLFSGQRRVMSGVRFSSCAAFPDSSPWCFPQSCWEMSLRRGILSQPWALLGLWRPLVNSVSTRSIICTWLVIKTSPKLLNNHGEGRCPRRASCLGTAGSSQAARNGWDLQNPGYSQGHHSLLLLPH